MSIYSHLRHYSKVIYIVSRINFKYNKTSVAYPHRHLKDNDICFYNHCLTLIIYNYNILHSTIDDMKINIQQRLLRSCDLNKIILE